MHSGACARWTDRQALEQQWERLPVGRRKTNETTGYATGTAEECSAVSVSPPMTAADTDDPDRLAWLAARSHKLRPRFDDGWSRPNGTVEKWFAGMLAAGKVRHAAEAAEGFVRTDPHHPSSQVLRALVPFLRRVGNRSEKGSGKRGTKGRTLTAEHAGRIEDARLTLWLAIYSRLLLKARRITRADAECFLTYFYFWNEPGWKLGRRRALDAIEPHALEVLTREKLGGFADERDWRLKFAEIVGDRLSELGIARSYLRGVAVELDT